MGTTALLIFLPAISLVFGWILAWIYLKQRNAVRLMQKQHEWESKFAVQQEQISSREITIENLEKEIKTQQELLEQKLLAEQTQQRLTDTFKALSAEALQTNNQSFLEMAKSTLEKYQEGARGDLDKRQQAIDQIIKPVKESLEKFDTKIQNIEKIREGAYQGLTQQVKSLMESENRLRSETASLVKALGTPRIRGRWGEMQLRRVVEMSGMISNCDFIEQQSVTTEEGRLRPDLVVHLPGKKRIVIDAKAPLESFNAAWASEDEEERRAHLSILARHIREHMVSLGRKSYWEQFQPSPEFVVLFLPGEFVFSAALEQDPSLIEQGVAEKVILATPTTLIALLKAVSYGWRQENLALNAKEISELGRDLYKRMRVMGGHFSELGSRLKKTVDSYNQSLRSMESRVLPSARKLVDLHAGDSDKEIEILDPIETMPRNVQAPELLENQDLFDDSKK